MAFTELIVPFALALEVNPISNINRTIIKVFFSIESPLNPRPEDSHPVVSEWMYLAVNVILLFFSWNHDLSAEDSPT